MRLKTRDWLCIYARRTPPSFAYFPPAPFIAVKSNLGHRHRAAASSGKSLLMAAGVHFDYSDNVNQEHLEKHSAKPSGAFSAASELPNF